MDMYIYSKNRNVLHNRGCGYVGRINPVNKRSIGRLRNHKDRPYTFCKYCGCEAVTRMHVNVTSNEIKQCVNVFKENEVSPDKLIKFFEAYKGEMSFRGRLLYIKVREDQWIIELKDNTIVLLHNNYFYKRGENKRYFTGGYHMQATKKNSLSKMLDYTMMYQFKHGI